MARQGTKAGAGRAGAGTTCRDTGRLLNHSSYHPCRQLLPDGAPFWQPLPEAAPFRQVAFLAGACCDSRFPRSSTAPRLAAPLSAPAGNLLIGALAGNKPLPAEKSTQVWLAIWRTWAGFANSQLRRAALRFIYLYICANPHCFHLETAAQTDAKLSAHLHDCLRHLRISAR